MTGNVIIHAGLLGRGGAVHSISDRREIQLPFPPFAPDSGMDVRDINRGAAMKLGLIDRDRQVPLKEVAAGCVWLGIPKMAEWQHVGNQIDAALILARSDFVNVLQVSFSVLRIHS
jgi:hypothetical protein